MKRRKFLAFLSVGTVAASIVKGLSERKGGVIITSSPTELSNHLDHGYSPPEDPYADLHDAFISGETVKVTLSVHGTIFTADTYEMTGLIAAMETTCERGPDRETLEIVSSGKQDDRPFPSFFNDNRETTSFRWRFDGEEVDTLIPGRKSRSITIVRYMHGGGWRVFGFEYIPVKVKVLK